MKTTFRLMMVCSLVLLVSAAVFAQDRSGGQLWVRAFEDRNGNGTRDPGEPLITRGIAVDLLDSSGTVIASALIDQSPNATQGLVGFQYLAQGQYMLSVTSAYYSATTASQFNAAIDPSMPPTVVEFGGQRIASPSGAPSAAVEQASAEEFTRQEALRIAISGLGALVMIGAMICFGLLLYGLVLRPRAVRRAQLDLIRASQTGSYPSVSVDPRASQTGQYSAARSTQTTGSMRPVRPDEDDPRSSRT
ncbi:MAG: SdrD B-like domain-containing protein [Anaerolineae bacterium]